MDKSFESHEVAGCTALRSEVAGCSALLQLVEAASVRSALQLLEAPEDIERCMATRNEITRANILFSLSCAMRSHAQINVGLRTLA